jgi:uncharacterized phage protein (TIGR02220 family)
MDKNNFIMCSTEIIQDKRLSLNQIKVLLALFSFRNNDTGLCFPSRNSISKKTGIRITTVSEVTTELESLEWVEKTWHESLYKYHVRIPDEKFRSMTWTEYREFKNKKGKEDTENNTVRGNSTEIVLGNRTHNRHKVTDIIIKPPISPIYEDIISDLNQKTGKNYKSTTSSTQGWINKRLKDGFTIEDFKTVHTNKAKDWNNSPEQNQYLRPETLYGNKFEGYLQQDEVRAVAVQAPPRFPSKFERDRETSSHLKRSLEDDRNTESNHSSITSLFRKLPSGSN